MKPMHEPIFEIRDAVHGFVTLTEAERQIINCPTFQRLRDVRQLAMAHLVYPGANHTRFEHSLGCMHLSTRILDLLILRDGHDGRPRFEDAFKASKDAVERGKKILRLASLLHDLGHPPFSHSGEDLFPLDAQADRHKRLDHEDMTARLIRHTEIGEAIDRYFGSHGIGRENVIAVATKPSLARPPDHATAWHMFLNEILAGELGSDRMDYLLRDAHHSGQSSGVFDYHRLLNAMTLVLPPDQASDGYRLGLDEGGWLAAEQMVVSRYMMYVSVYFHKTSRAYELHLVDFLQSWLRRAFGVPHWPADPSQFVAQTDSAVLAGIQNAARDDQDLAHGHAKRFLSRSHFRLAKELTLADSFVTIDDRSGGRGRRHPNESRFEGLFRNVLDNAKNNVRFSLGSEGVKKDMADHSATKMFSGDDRILVSLDKKTRYVDELSEIVRGMSSRIWRGRIYAEPEARNAIRGICDAYLKDNPLPREAEDG